MVKVQLTVKMDIEIKSIEISHLAKLDASSINRLLHEIKKQIQHLFPYEIRVRERHTSGLRWCPYCKKEFNGSKGLNLHITKAHSDKRKTPAILFLSAHKIKINKVPYLYILLENISDKSSQKIMKIKLPRKNKNNL
ncbi:MAG: hypothetical protein ACTSU4_13795 [Promethearchaeota archaeon]